MTNADKFKAVFGMYSEEFWAKPEQDMLSWINSEYQEPQTNAYRIRSMTDEELAEWMCTEYRKIPWCRSDNEEDIESGKCRPQVCIICANVWLKEEVGDVT